MSRPIPRSLLILILACACTLAGCIALPTTAPKTTAPLVRDPDFTGSYRWVDEATSVQIRGGASYMSPVPHGKGEGAILPYRVLEPNSVVKVVLSKESLQLTCDVTPAGRLADNPSPIRTKTIPLGPPSTKWEPTVAWKSGKLVITYISTVARGTRVHDQSTIALTSGGQLIITSTFTQTGMFGLVVPTAMMYESIITLERIP